LSSKSKDAGKNQKSAMKSFEIASRITILTHHYRYVAIVDL
jgi:hypothetical protein